MFLVLALFSSAQDYQLSNENIQFEFKTTKGKRLVVAIDQEANYLVYRFGSDENIELEYPKNLEDSWNKFEFSWYLRGGGFENEGMDLNYLTFKIGEYLYVVFSEYYSSEEKTSYGIKVMNLKSNNQVVIPADLSTVKGNLTDLRDVQKLKKIEELF